MMRDHPHDYIFENTRLAGLTFPDLLRHSTSAFDADKMIVLDIQPLSLEVDAGLFGNASPLSTFPDVTVTQSENTLVLSCPCTARKANLCIHQSQVLHTIMGRASLRMFFDPTTRLAKLKQFAVDYGMENEPNLDEYFALEYVRGAVVVKSKLAEMLPYNEQAKTQIQAQLFSKPTLPQPTLDLVDARLILILRPHKYYHDQFHIELYEAQLGSNGKVKAPFKLVDPHFLIWNADDIDAAKFYIAISKLQHTEGARNADSLIELLEVIVRNPLKIEAYYHNAAPGESLKATTLTPVLLRMSPMEVRLTVDQKAPFYEVSGELLAYDKSHPLKTLEVKFEYFIQFKNILQLVRDPNTLRVISFFKKHHQKILIHPSKFDAFRKEILDNLELDISIKYAYIKPATKQQLVTHGFDLSVEKMIYLSDGRNYIHIMPVIRYGNVEVPVFSKRQIYETDANGNTFKVDRDPDLELRFIAMLVRQHPDFEEQLKDNEDLSLHRSKFLDEDWFLETFAQWRDADIQILGFNALSKNKLNLHRGTVTVKVSSDMDWFNAKVKLQYGNQTASLVAIQKSLKNKSKYVQLDDGTMGILPAEWIDRFAQYFNAGEIVDDLIVAPKSKFLEINELFDQAVIAQETRSELAAYVDRFSNFKGIQAIPVPSALQGTLRDYQKEGLNWLNCLDDFNFGACLADDMGLGKTIQIIALILSQRSKRSHNTNLVVVPTSLLFNWQAEVAKFAPSIQLYTNYGATRLQDHKAMDGYEIILTTYGMLQSDIELLRGYRFNYIILDESQAIKNPESQRYKLVRLLQSRNKIALTGTPFENNTYDIYGQLSFACPGLLGNKVHFKNIYSDPIDRFEDGGRADKLKKIIHPFILRRTKKQVAKELPEKTEMVLYCEMGPEQRQLYEAAAQEVREMINAPKKGNNKHPDKQPMYFLKGLTKLRQICNSPNILKEGGFEGEVSSKIDVLMDQITSKSPQHKILVFSQFVTMLDLIKTELETRHIAFAYLTGQTKNRASQVHDFQTNDDVRVFLISLKAGGTGLNLTEADYVYLVDPWWNPAVENQAIDRCYRIGQQKKVVAIKLICPGTIEEKIMLLQAKKERLGSELIKSDSEILKSLSREDLLGLLG